MIDTDIIVASRFHNVVCALKLSKPTISIGYEAKTMRFDASTWA